MDDPQRPDQFRAGDPHDAQGAGRQFAADRRLGKQRDPGVDLHRPLDRLDVVELHHDLGLGVVTGQGPVELVADDEVAVEADHARAAQLAEAHLDAVRQRVAGCTDEHDRLLPPRLRLQRARAARVADDADVGLPLLDRLDDAIGVEVFETDVGLGVPAHELLHVAAHVVEADGVDRRHAHAARDLVMQRPDRIHQRIIAGDDLPAAVIEHLPLAGRRQGPLGPLDEPHAEL